MIVETPSNVLYQDGVEGDAACCAFNDIGNSLNLLSKTYRNRIECLRLNQIHGHGKHGIIPGHRSDKWLGEIEFLNRLIQPTQGNSESGCDE